MDANSLMQYLGTALISSIGIGWFIRSAITHVMQRDLEQYKSNLDAEHNFALESFRKAQEKALQDQREAHERGLEAFRKGQEKILQDQREAHERRLEAFRKDQEKILQDQHEAHERNLLSLQGETNKGLEQIKSGLQRIDRLESELMKSRGEAYAEIWKLMHSVNLFGPPVPQTASQLSENLTNWYFTHGWNLTKGAKKRYFLVQEVLNFFVVRSIPFSRPAGERLFAGNDRTIELLRQLRKEQLGIEPKDDDSFYELKELGDYVTAFKGEPRNTAAGEAPAQRAWLLLQLVMSAFRSQVTNDLGSREEVPTLAQ
ncbi:MAG TPA: hypothetical protein VKB38_20700 [Terracidiphilus sp.]|nr:hypothetical protein [Terracidiphilus sp.]